MSKYRNRFSFISFLLFASVIVLLAGCSGDPADTANPGGTGTPGPTTAATGGNGGSTDKPEQSPDASTPSSEPSDKGTTKPTTKPTSKPSTKPTKDPDKGNGKGDSGTNQADPDAVQVVANPKDLAVLVNKSFRLPAGYKPETLVEPNVPFIFKEKLEKRKMRKEAAEALEKLFAAATEEGVSLAGVSGYRSQATQEVLYNNYVKRDGVEAANKYSAKPGFSEHQTGLVMDVSGISGKCAAEDCFADTKEAKWLAENAAEHGFIVRYLKGKESITGYQYEPWHIRYVGVDISKEIAEQGITLEEYFKDTIPVTK
ncbi:M15 family metallopeptidase [Paenibacillus eucommiae]|uniref:D-alanyl-D-alanine carboxypeptidase n=1 Tax=Paenibacillus eucommiae TaxID=1355755 RepID=A0ABS4JB51_9BACL|nr:M15 family metallopeptidase [Paenibacillus eucommiae]MBP1997078.1 D-alanyl-D-alanine carboxypeptidase [Paenibacillus eucommiae]